MALSRQYIFSPGEIINAPIIATFHECTIDENGNLLQVFEDISCDLEEGKKAPETSQKERKWVARPRPEFSDIKAGIHKSS